MKAETISKVEDRSYTQEQLADRAVYRRAIEAAIWGMPAVNYYLMYREMVNKLKGDFNQVLYWSRLLDWKNQTLTPNQDVIYLMPFFNTMTAGPMVLDVPPADEGIFNGSIMNYWQSAIEDVGPGGVDKGKGGKYLILPPGYDNTKIPEGYIPMHSDTFHGYALLRSVLKSGSDEDVAKAVSYAKRIKLYPLLQASDPAPTKFIDASDTLFDSTIRYDFSFFESLNEMVQAEPWLERDKIMIDILKTIGIERGKQFKADDKTKQVLTDAMKEAKAWFESRYDSLPPYYEGEHWFFPTTEEMFKNVISFWKTPDSYPIDARGTVYTLAFFSAKHLGQSQYYLLTGKDEDGDSLMGNENYTLHVPPNVPVTQYWSMTVYDRNTHAFILNADRVGRSSQSFGLQINEDHSVDLFFGPKAPEGKESNWVPTGRSDRFEVLARFYGPQDALFTKAWKLPDLEKVD